MKLELISFDLCPYVQRSAITLLYKDVAHKITYIDLVGWIFSPPRKFLESCRGLVE